MKNTSEVIKRHVSSLLWKYKKKADVNVVKTSPSSYCYPKGEGYYIQVGGALANALTEDEEERLLVLKGLASHEVAHVLYTNFSVMGKIRERENNFKANVKVLAKRYLDGEAGVDKLIYQAIYGYVYNKNLAVLLNSYEDAAIEHYIPIDFPKTYGGLILLRNRLTTHEKKSIKNYVSRLSDDDYSEEMLNSLISEIRHCAVIGYRAPDLEYDLLSKKGVKEVLKKYKITNKQIKLIKQLGIHARLITKSTEERELDSIAVMNIIKPLIKEKATLFYEQYMKTVEDESAFDGDDGFPPMGQEELSIYKRFNSKSPVAPPPPSEYELDVPDEVQEEIDKANEEKENMDKSDSSNGAKDDSNSSDSKDNDSEPQEEGSEGSECNSESDKSNGKSQKDNSKVKDKNTSEETKDGKSGTDCDNMDAIASEFGEQKSVQEQAKDALKSLEKEIKSLKKENESELVKEAKKQINDTNSSGKAPTKIGDGVKWTKTQVFTKFTSSCGDVSRVNKKRLESYANKFAQKLKKKILYSTKAKILRGQIQGKINTGSIYRVKGDGKICKTKETHPAKRAIFSILIDQSGSMCGEKMKEAVEGSYMVAVALNRIKVPYELCGHNHNLNCDYYKYVDFKSSRNSSTCENIFLAKSGGGNHDSSAIYESLSSLARNKKQDENAVFLIISDGAPAAGSYGGRSAYKNIQAIYTFFEKEYGIKTIGIGIGTDTMHVPYIYSNYVLTPNVETLGEDLLKIIEIVLK